MALSLEQQFKITGFMRDFDKMSNEQKREAYKLVITQLHVNQAEFQKELGKRWGFIDETD